MSLFWHGKFELRDIRLDVTLSMERLMAFHNGACRVSVFASIRGNFWLDAVSILRDHFFKNRMQLPLFSLLQIGASHVFDRIGLFRIRGIVDRYEYRKMILLLWKYPETNCINLKVKISRSKIIITSKSPILLK